jgi:hypothetical protein
MDIKKSDLQLAEQFTVCAASINGAVPPPLAFTPPWWSLPWSGHPQYKDPAFPFGRARRSLQ